MGGFSEARLSTVSPHSGCSMPEKCDSREGYHGILGLGKDVIEKDKLESERAFEEARFEESEEAKTPKVKSHGYKPSPKEVEEHNVTHMPFRSWCPFCVKGKAKDESQKRGKGS